MSIAWYALNSQPNKEDLLYRQLENGGYEGYFPRIRVNPVNPRSRKIRPYFPGYLFVKADIEKIGVSTFNWMPYAKSIVSFGGEPAIVPDSLIQAIQKKIETINAAGGEIFEDLHAGDEIAIATGPFEGYDAIFDTRLDGSARVRVLLKMLSENYMPLELDVANIEKKKKKNK